MADTIQHDGAEAEEDGFDRVDLLRLCDGLANDRYNLRAIGLAVWGLQDSGVDRQDLQAISELVERAEDNLQERQGQAEEIREAWAKMDDAEALRRPGEGYWHRDSQLVDAWKEWQAAMRARLEAPDDLPEAEDQSLDRAVDEAEARLEGLPARTPLGLAVKVRYLFQMMELSREAQNALVYDKPITDEMLRDGRERFGWSVVQAAERLARPARSA